MTVHGGAFGLQDFHHFIGGGGSRVLFEVAGYSEDGVAHADLGYAIRAAGGAGDVGLAGHIGFRVSFHFSRIFVGYQNAKMTF